LVKERLTFAVGPGSSPARVTVAAKPPAAAGRTGHEQECEDEAFHEMDE
jgi:hypothetical protein